MFKFSQRSLDNLKGVHPDLVRLMNLSISTSPIDFTITEGLRTMGRQQELYNQGRTKPGSIVTNCDGVLKKSNHQAKLDGYGHAVDLYPYIHGGVVVNDFGSLKVIATHIKSVAKKNGINVVWGGDWKSPFDPPHFELG